MVRKPLRLSVGTLKGGTGKTTTAVNLAAALTLAGQRVLLVDLDLQNDTTVYCSVQPSVELSVGTLLLDENIDPTTHVLDVTHLVDYNPNGGKLLLLPSELSSLEEAAYKLHREGDLFALKRLLARLGDIADIIIIDNKPELGWLHLLACATIDAAMAVMQPQMMTTRGMVAFQASLKKLNQNRADNDQVAFLGVIINQDMESEEAGWVDAALAQGNFPVFDTRVPFSLLISKAYSHGRPATLHFPTKPPAAIYVDLATEVLKRATSCGLVAT